ncbi:EMB976 [Symbiodinium sp. KB8]|nr:EMB976 [Symbiodinium sp. KB8]
MAVESRAFQSLSTIIVSLVATSIPASLALAGGFLWTTRVEWAWTLLGAVLLDTCVLQLKGLLQQPRPVQHAAYVLPSEGPFGMPSEHAAFAGFLLGQLHARGKNGRPGTVSLQRKLCHMAPCTSKPPSSDYRWWANDCPTEKPGLAHCVTVIAEHSCGKLLGGKNAGLSAAHERRVYTRLISNLGKRGQPAQAVQALREMQQNGIKPDKSVYNALVAACINCQCRDSALNVFEEMRGAGFELDEEIRYDLISLCGFAQDWKKSLELLQQLRDTGTVPKENSYCSVVRVCCRCKQYPTVLKLLTEMEAYGLDHYQVAQKLRVEFAQCLPTQPWQQWETCRASDRQPRLAAAGFSRGFRACAMCLLALWAAGILCMRYITGAHSIVQLLAGAASGIGASSAWSKLEEGPLADAMVASQCFADSTRRCVAALYGF